MNYFSHCKYTANESIYHKILRKKHIKLSGEYYSYQHAINLTIKMTTLTKWKRPTCLKNAFDFLYIIHLYPITFYSVNFSKAKMLHLLLTINNGSVYFHVKNKSVPLHKIKRRSA